jgi:hypothetical protein
MCTPVKVEHAVTSQSTLQPNDFNVVPATIALDDLTMTPDVTCVVKENQRKYEQLHFGFVAQ